MKRSAVLGLLATVAMGSTAIGRVAQEMSTIQRSLVADSVEIYKGTSKVTQTLNSPVGDIPINVETKTTYTLKTMKVDQTKGSADVELTSTIDSMDGGDSPLTSQLSGKKVDPLVQQGTLDKKNHLELKAATNTDRLMSIVTGLTGGLESSMFIELPDHSVKIGDSWDIVIPKGPYTGDADQKISATLTGEKKVNGADAYTVDLSGTVNIAFDSSKMPATTTDPTSTLNKYQVMANGTTKIKGTGVIDKATGKTLSLDTSSELKTKIQVEGQADMKADGTGTLETSLKLQS